MSDNSYKSKKNLLKGIGTLCIFGIFGYYSYQDAMNKKMLEKSLNENAASQQYDFGRTAYKDASGETHRMTSGSRNDCDTFNEHLDEYLADPEDELTFPPEIYDAQIDDEEDELITNEIDY